MKPVDVVQTNSGEFGCSFKADVKAVSESLVKDKTAGSRRLQKTGLVPSELRSASFVVVNTLRPSTGW